MSTPTDAELNRAMAEVCGWDVEEDRKWPKYCTDRNALANVLEKISRENAPLFGYHICQMKHWDHSGMVEGYILYILKLEPRMIVTAVLKTIGKWREEWTP